MYFQEEFTEASVHHDILRNLSPLDLEVDPKDSFRSSLTVKRNVLVSQGQEKVVFVTVKTSLHVCKWESESLQKHEVHSSCGK